MEPVALPSAPMWVLLIEDEARLAGSIRRGLEEEGYRVDVAGDAVAGERLALANAYDAFVVDWRLPRGDGKTLVERIRAEGRDQPVLMLTALSDVEHRVAGLDAGADDYLPKPFAFEELVARLRALLRRPPLSDQERTVTVGPLTLDGERRKVTMAGPKGEAPLHSPRSPCPLLLPSRPSPVSSSPPVSSVSLAAAPRPRVASGLSRGRSASLPRGPPSSPAARRALTGWPAGCRRRSCSARHASGGGVAASRVGLSPSCAVWLVRVGPVPAPSPRSGCRRLGGRALGGWRRPGRRRLASRASAPGPGRLWRSRSAWASRLSCGSQRVPRRPRAGGSPSSAPGGGVPGGAPQRWPRGAATSGGAVRPGRRRRRPVHTPP